MAPAQAPVEEEARPDSAPAAPAATEELIREMRYLLRARNPLIWIVTPEEYRAESIISAAAAAENYKFRTWDCAVGARDVNGKSVEIGGAGKPATSPAAVFDKIRVHDERAVWVLRDLHDWTQDRMVVRNLKSIAQDLKNMRDRSKLTTIVVLTASDEIPLNLRNSALRWDLSLPTRAEAAQILDESVLAGRQREQISIEEWGDLPRARKAAYKRVRTTEAGSEVMERVETDDEVRLRRFAAGDAEELAAHIEAVVDAAVGLTSDDMSAAFARSIVRHRRVDPGVVAAEKKRIVDREKVLTWYTPDRRGLAAIGGLGRLKAWLEARRVAFTHDAREYGLQAPRGIALVGPPGCGKSSVAKVVATIWGMPLLQMDWGALKAPHVGESERLFRSALKTATAVAPAILWWDELEKAIRGAEGSGDSGVSSNQLGTALTWMQEHQETVPVIATINNPQHVAPEMFSRFDEVWFVDLPYARERQEVLEVSLRRRVPGYEGGMNLTGAVQATELFSGRELDKLVVAAQYAAYPRPLRPDDLVREADLLVPVAKSARERIDSLREWAKTRARNASEPEDQPVRTSGYGRSLELDPADIELEEEEIQ